MARLIDSSLEKLSTIMSDMVFNQAIQCISLATDVDVCKSPAIQVLRSASYDIRYAKKYCMRIS